MPHTTMLTWRDVQRAAKMLRSDASQSITGKWGGLISGFLEKAKQPPFQEFHVPKDLTPPTTTLAFWKQRDV